MKRWSDHPRWLAIEFFLRDCKDTLWVLAPNPCAALKHWRRARHLSKEVLIRYDNYLASPSVNEHPEEKP